MPPHYQVFAKCPVSKVLVRTGYKVESSEFMVNEKSVGAYNCYLCQNAHSWSYDDKDIQIRLVAA